MQDRVPLYPGRVTLTPVSGQANTFDLTRADQPTQEGTPLNKATLLKDATAALFGLPNTAVPDDALHLLSRFQSGLGNEYIWAKYTQSISYGDNLTTSQVNILSYGSSSKAQYSTNAKIEGKSVVMVDPIEITYDQIKSSPDILKGKYYTPLTNSGSSVISKNTLYFIPDTSRIWVYNGEYIDTNDIRIPIISNNLTGYVNSPSPDAYPPDVSDGDTYTLLGQLGDKVRIATGSYTGTGTYGASNPNSLTFSFEPKLVFMFKDKFPVYGSVSSTTSYPVYGTTIGMTTTYSRSLFNIYGRRSGDDYYLYAKKSSDGKTLSWYHEARADDQINGSGATYRYIAIG